MIAKLNQPYNSMDKDDFYKDIYLKNRTVHSEKWGGR
jgi:hypothetical protein